MPHDYLIKSGALREGESFSTDGGLVTVALGAPVGSVWTEIVRSVTMVPFLVEEIRVNVFDPGAVNVLEWRLTRNGIAIPPWTNQRMPGGDFEAIVRPHWLGMAGVFSIYARIIAGALAFEALGRITGIDYQWKGREGR